MLAHEKIAATSVRTSRRDNRNSDIWVSDISGIESTRLTFDSNIDEHPIWSPHDDAIIFANDGTGRANLYRSVPWGSPEEAGSGNGGCAGDQRSSSGVGDLWLSALSALSAHLRLKR
jgi:hypothetical protein